VTYDVAIIGCGPVGALAANLLGKAGLHTLVVEREAELHPLPRAVHVDHEMMRLFQAAGVIDRVGPHMRETDGNLHVGADGHVIRYLGTAGLPRPYGWASDYFFYQPELEGHLRAALERFPHVELLAGTSFEGLGQDESGVTLSLTSESTARQARARWVIACDGASSTVRKTFDVPLHDLGFEEPWLVVDVEADGPVTFPDLGGLPQSADLQRLSVMMCNPQRPTTVVPGRGNHRRWEFMLLPGEDEDEMAQPAVVAKLVAPWLTGVPHRIVRGATYRFHGLIAERWQTGRVFLAGDAAHQTPPFFGQGMCHGLRDVANLAWKLELVAKGRASARLLDTYQTERDSQVRRVISLAVEAGRYICILDPEAAAARDRAMREQVSPFGEAGPPAELIPPIDHGVLAAGTPAAGERFIQPRVGRGADAALLDDVTGTGWRLFVRDAAIAALAREQATGNAASATIVDAATLDDAGAVTAWLARRGIVAALVRPDFYVFGSVVTAARLQHLYESLRRAIPGASAETEREERVV